MGTNEEALQRKTSDKMIRQKHVWQWMKTASHYFLSAGIELAVHYWDQHFLSFSKSMSK
jgi:hypothetical protein